MGTSITKRGEARASGDVNPNLFLWQNSGPKIITLNVYQNTGSFTQFTDCLTFDPSTTVGTKYTISFWARSPNGTTSLQIYNRNNNPRYFYFNTTTLSNSLSNAWKFFTYTFTNTDQGSGDTSTARVRRIEIYMPSQMGGQVRDIKIEAGEVATAWIPASADLSYAGADCGFYETLGSKASIAKESMSAAQFYEI